jgi:hypothetical protein
VLNLKQTALHIRVTKVNDSDHWQVFLDRDMVEIIWAVSENIPTLLSRIAYYNAWREAA